MDDELKTMASRWDVWVKKGISYDAITVERRMQEDESYRYVIFENGSSVFSLSLKTFIYDSIPSNRTKEHMEDTRLTSLGQAIDIAKQIASQYQAKLDAWQNGDRSKYINWSIDSTVIKVD